MDSIKSVKLSHFFTLVRDSESTDVCSETSSSVVVDESSLIDLELSLPGEGLDNFFEEISHDDEKSDETKLLKSPDVNNVDSGSSTSHTLKDVGASESSESYDVHEVAMTTDLAQEESTSEFEYVAAARNE